MLSRLLRGQRARSFNIDSVYPGSQTHLQDARRTAWTLLHGDTRPLAEPGFSRRPHRGLLPDIDPSRLEPDPDHQPLGRRLIGAIRRLLGRSRRRKPAASDLPGRSVSPLGEHPPASYMGITEAGDPMDFVGASQASHIAFPRAA